MKHQFLSLVEHAYQLEHSNEQWYRRIAELASRIVPGAEGAMAYSFDASSPGEGVQIRNWGASSVPDSFVEATLELNRRTDATDAARFYRQGILCGTVSEVLMRNGSSTATNESYRSAVADRGVPDTFGLTASNPSWTGLAVNSPLEALTTIGARTRRAWLQTGVHLHAAFRLRQSLESSSATPEAVIDPNRGIVHCESAAKPKSLRESLQQAVRRVDAARTANGPKEADEALGMWEGLVRGRWTLIETFESDGRRHFVAYANEPMLGNPLALTLRERAVVAYAVQGDSNKWIAYQLGIAPATVATHLGNSLRKLGLKHRNELIWLYHSLHRE